MIDNLRLGLLQAELALYPTDGIVLNPADWAHIELTKDRRAATSSPTAEPGRSAAVGQAGGVDAGDDDRQVPGRRLQAADPVRSHVAGGADRVGEFRRLREEPLHDALRGAARPGGQAAGRADLRRLQPCSRLPALLCRTSSRWRTIASRSCSLRAATPNPARSTSWLADQWRRRGLASQRGRCLSIRDYITFLWKGGER
jgi:hypothetical protein